uniref:HRDC domain-containing protein n=1 Tax=uncultured Corynebacterium sp. TaxID=159447 RepID=UPI0025FA8A9A
RASGFRFDDRAWLVQLRRAGSGTHLVDPVVVPEAGRLLAPVMNGLPWVLHAAHTDLPALTTLGWRTPLLHDTQIAGRLLGYGQIGLAGMLEELLGVTVAKDKGREDWSARPLPADMLTYAALDVELLVELLSTALSRLRHRGESEGLDRIGWYRQECAHVRADWSRPVQTPDWTRLRGIGAVRDPRGWEVARRLTDIRTEVARRRDTPPEKVLHSSVIVDLARSPHQAEDLLRGERRGGPGVRNARDRRQGRRDVRPVPRLPRELRALLLTGVRDALSADPAALPTRPPAPRGRPDHRTWARDFPVADRLATGFRTAVDVVADRLDLHPSELIVSASVRSVAWDAAQLLDTSGSRPGTGADEGYLTDPVGWAEETLGGLLAAQHIRPWQTDLLIPALLPTLAEEMPGPGKGTAGC